ncbi:MAG: Asp23/Gls24 family envelope stress response protein, partial [Acidobacteriota bacterium]|nr:Asp23/Gls24 family envelope stress response protein [Acidobacteriota bacterium]
MDGQASISTEILARYAGDAAREIAGVRALYGRHAVRVDEDLRVEVHVAVDWGASIPAVGKSVQARVR